MARKVDPKAVQQRIKDNKVIMKNSSKSVKYEMAKATKIQDFDSRLARASFSEFLKAAINVSNDTALLNKEN